MKGIKNRKRKEEKKKRKEKYEMDPGNPHGPDQKKGPRPTQG
jgi:hypothetical protein